MVKAERFNGVQLCMTLEQAFYLRQLLMNVGGDPKGPRGHMDQICEALGKFRGDFEDLDLPDLYCEGNVVMDDLINFEK